MTRKREELVNTTVKVALRAGRDILALERDCSTGKNVYTFNDKVITKEESNRILAEWRVTNRELELIS